MNNIKEDRALLDVRAWKERSYQNNKQLSIEDYIRKLEELAQKIMTEYGFELEHVPVERA